MRAVQHQTAAVGDGDGNTCAVSGRGVLAATLVRKLESREWRGQRAPMLQPDGVIGEAHRVHRRRQHRRRHCAVARQQRALVSRRGYAAVRRLLLLQLASARLRNKARSTAR